MQIPIIGQTTALVGLPPKDELRQIGREMITHAYTHQCWRAEDAKHPSFFRSIGVDWHVGLTLERFREPPMYHASFEALHTIKSDDEANLGIPELAIIRISDWPSETRKIAGEILGEIMAPLIRTADQKILVQEGLFAIHWLTEAPYAD